MIREILKLGDPRLYEISTCITGEELPMIPVWAEDLRDTLLDYRRNYGAGRAIAAPQIGIAKRMIYMLTDREYVIVNPVLTFPDEERFEVLDDCMSFPGLCVRVMRYRHTVLDYTDAEGNACRIFPGEDLSELVQHEYDHLDGILATMRAIDDRSFVLMQMKREFR